MPALPAELLSLRQELVASGAALIKSFRHVTLSISGIEIFQPPLVNNPTEKGADRALGAGHPSVRALRLGSQLYMFSISAWPNSLHLSSVARSISRSKS